MWEASTLGNATLSAQVICHVPGSSILRLLQLSNPLETIRGDRKAHQPSFEKSPNISQ